MTKDAQLREIQKRIAEARGWHSIIYWDAFGRLQGMDGSGQPPDLVPLWPQEWRDAGVLVEEMQGFAQEKGVWCEWGDYFEGHAGGRHRFRLYDGERRRDGFGASFAEAAARCWCAFKGIDLSDLT